MAKMYHFIKHEKYKYRQHVHGNIGCSGRSKVCTSMKLCAKRTGK